MVKFVGEITGRIGVYFGIQRIKHECTLYDENLPGGAFVKKNEIIHTAKGLDASIPRVSVGDIVYVKSFQFNCNAIIRYIGNYTPNTIWFGLQLEKPLGDNNGIVDKEMYFRCGENFGKFIRLTDLDIEAVHKTKKIKNKKAKRKKKEKKNKKKKKMRDTNGTYMPFRKFMKLYEAESAPSLPCSFKQDMIEFYNQKFYNFFVIYSQRSDLSRDVMDLIVRYCSQSNDIDTKRSDLYLSSITYLAARV